MLNKIEVMTCLLFFVLSLNVVHGCSNSTAMELILNQTNSSELVDLIKLLCSLINQTNMSLDMKILSLEIKTTGLENKTNNFTLSLNESTFYLKEKVSKIDKNVTNGLDDLNNSLNNCYNNTEGAALEDRINTIYERDTYLAEFQDNISELTDQKKIELEDVFDDKINNIKDDLEKQFMTTAEYYENRTQDRTWVVGYVQQELNFIDRYAIYAFLGVVATIAIGVIVVKYGPSGIKKGLTLKDLKGEPHTPEEVITRSDLKTKIENIRKLKLTVVRKKKLKKEKKAKLLAMIDNGKIISAEDLEKEVEILRGI